MLTNNAVQQPGHPPVNEADPLEGATLHWPPLQGYEAPIRAYFAAAYRLNRRLNALLFASLGMPPAEEQRLGGAPFAVLKQLR